MIKTIKKIMAIVLSFVMVLSSSQNLIVYAETEYKPVAAFIFNELQVGDHLSDFIPLGGRLVFLDSKTNYGEDMIDIDMEDCVITYMVEKDSALVPIEPGENPEIEVWIEYGVQIEFAIPKSEISKYNLDVNTVVSKQEWPSAILPNGFWGINADGKYTAVEDGDNIKFTILYTTTLYSTSKQQHIITINRDKVKEYYEDTNKTEGKLETLKTYITNDFDETEFNSLELVYEDDVYPSFVDEEKSINIAASNYSTLKMKFNFRSAYVENVGGITIIEVNNEGTEVNRCDLTFDSENDYLSQNNYFNIYSDYGTMGREGHEINVGYQLDFNNNDKVNIYFPDYYDYDDTTNTYTLKDGVSDEYIPMEVTKGNEVKLPSLSKDDATNDILGWTLYKDGGKYFKNKVKANSNMKLYPFDGSLKIIEQPTKENNYQVKTNLSDLCDDYLTYNWYKVEMDDTFEYTQLDNQSDLYKSGNDVRIYFSSPIDDNKIKTTYSNSGLNELYIGAKNWPPNTLLTYTFNNDIDLDALYKDYSGNYVYDKNSRTIFVKTTSLESPYVYIKGLVDLSGTYSFVCENEQKEVIDCHTANLTASQSGFYVCEVYGKNASDKLYTIDTYYEAKKSSSSSKTYKAKNTNDTACKIAGSGKKGSKRTITPIEGKKVGTVVVTDKDGNKVEVTPNADGTYSFIQPASDVNVEVTYVNREITLNIGSTEADVDGEKSNLDVCPVIRNDRTMLPIRFVAENLGAKVEWSEKNPDYVLITRGDIKIEITLGSDVMKVNGKEVKLDSVAFAENDRTYLPVRAISENLNAVVEWNEARPMEVKIYER